jgi:hypothetical protein
MRLIHMYILYIYIMGEIKTLNCDSDRILFLRRQCVSSLDHSRF